MSKIREIATLGSALSIVHWDLETYMPPGAIQLRSEQLGLIQQLLHRMGTSKEMGNLIGKAEKDIDSLDEVGKRNLFLSRKEYDEATRLPEELVANIAKQEAISVNTWKQAKEKKDWKMFKPELEKTIDLSRQKYEILMDVKGTSNVYNAMIDDFESGMNADKISTVFGELRDGLDPLVKKYADVSKETDSSFLKRKVPIDVQRRIAEDLAELVEYDITTKQAKGRIDETEHPFTTGYFDDVRITVHYHEDNFSSMVFAILHEAGHALYELGLNRDYMYQPVGLAASYGIHESMSRFVENMYGRSMEFWKYYLPRMNKLTDDIFSDVSVQDFVKASNLVQPSKIRIEADEVTYSLHIIIRFEIERNLFAGKVTIDELPQVWNEKYKEYLGMDIKNDSEGVMQDTHWASGYFGYFPSYALGNIYDGMWLEKLEKDVPDWLHHTEKGSFSPIKTWLTDNVYKYSKLYDPDDLVNHVVGQSLTAKPFLTYLEKKYADIFGF